jgi:transposase
MTKKSSKKRKFTSEFKSDAVKLVTENGYTCREAARRLGIGVSSLSRWVREHRDERESNDGGEKSRRELETEIKRLEKENQRLQMEREILKKAAAFFAKESN